MNTFKVGDEVLVKGKIDAISPDSGKPWINFEGWHLYLSEKTIVSLVKASTAIPEGWTPATTNPDHVRITNTSDDFKRNLCLLREDGTQGYGWKWVGSHWIWFGTEYSSKMTDPSYNDADATTIQDVIAWKELENLNKSGVPEGWNTRESLENQPGKDWSRNVQVIRADGTQGYGYRFEDKWFFRETASPHLYEPAHSCSMSMIDPDKIVGWKELDSQLPDGWNSPDTLENREDHTNTRNVQVIRKDGQTGYGWRGLSYWYFTETYRPEMHDPNSSYGDSLHNTDNPIVGWKELDPELPEGWTPANTPPADPPCRNVQILLPEGIQAFGWKGDNWWKIGDVYNPRMKSPLYTGDCVNLGNTVLGWKELEPEPTPEPELPIYRLKVGDKIVHKNHLNRGEGTIIKLDYDDPNCPYLVNWASGEFWTVEENAVKVDL